MSTSRSGMARSRTGPSRPGTPNTLLRRGLRKQDLPAGTELKVSGYQARDGTAKANGINVTLPDGRALFIGSGGAAPRQRTDEAQCRPTANAASGVDAGCRGGRRRSSRPVQTQGGPIPRTSWDKKPDLNGIWQTLSTANWDLEDHEGGPSPVFVTGAWGATSSGPERRRGREDSLQAGSAGEAGREPEECPSRQAGPKPERRSGVELFSSRACRGPPIFPTHFRSSRVRIGCGWSTSSRTRAARSS